MSGTVIIINGSSASGKSTIQKKVQELFDEPYLALGIDSLFDNILPDYYGLGEIRPKGLFREEEIRSVEKISIEGKDAIKLMIGPIGQKVIKGMHESIAAYAKQGNNIVVDYILYDHSWLPDLIRALQGLTVYWVGIQYPLDIIEEREMKRATSPVGHARSHHHSIHEGMNYDLIVSDPSLSTEQIALQIKELLS